MSPSKAYPNSASLSKGRQSVFTQSLFKIAKELLYPGSSHLLIGLLKGGGLYLVPYPGSVTFKPLKSKTFVHVFSPLPIENTQKSRQ